MLENTEKVWVFCQSWSVSTCGTEQHDIPGAKEILGFKKGLDIHKDANVSMSTGEKHETLVSDSWMMGQSTLSGILQTIQN